MQYDKIGARVIARDSEKWFQVFRINKGSADGIAVDMNVVAGGGLVGIVTDVGANYATVRSIIDDSSRVGAMSVDSSYNCIVAGDLTLYAQGRLRLTDFSRDAVLDNGDQIVTSNISTKFLPGIPEIGYAVDVTMDPDHLTQSGYLIPAADFDNLQEVLVITEFKTDRRGGKSLRHAKLKQILINMLFIVMAFTIQNCVFPAASLFVGCAEPASYPDLFLWLYPRKRSGDVLLRRIFRSPVGSVLQRPFWLLHPDLYLHWLYKRYFYKILL